MRRIFHVAVACLVLVAIFGLTKTLQVNTQHKVIGGGSFHIYQKVGDDWEELYVEPFVTEYETKTFRFTPNNGELTLRINQKTVSYGDIELLELRSCGQKIEPIYARYVDDNVSVLEDIQGDDNDVVVAHEKPIEVTWVIPEGCTEQAALTMKANEYESPEKNAFRFPDWDIKSERYTFQNNGSLNIDGSIVEVDDIVDPNYSPFWKSGTGHPSNNTHIYLKDDSEYVYVAADILLDNTSEYGQDWFKLIVQNSITGSEKEYRVDDYHSQYGKCSFGRTSKVAHKHQTCEIRIPKSEINGQSMEFVLRYYGTSGGDPSVAIDQLTIANSSDTTPTLTGRARGIDGAGEITSVTFGIYNNTIDEVVVADYEGTCTADDGDFDETTEMFSCTPSSALLYNHFVFNVRGEAGGDNGTGSTEFFVVDDAFSTQSNTDGFGDAGNYSVQAFAVFNSKLYAGTYNENTGAEVWEYNGTSWTQSNTDGFGDANNYGVQALAVLNNKLYAGTHNEVTGPEVWEYNGTSWTQSNTDGFGDGTNHIVLALAVFNNKLYAGTYNNNINTGAEVWEYNGTSWTQSNTDGFGDPDNQRVLSLHVHNSTLYAGTFNSVDGAELWKFNGTSWTLEDNAGLGNSNNQGIYSMTTFNNALYVGTLKSNGSQLLTGSGGSWTQANSNGFTSGQTDSQEISSLIVYNGRIYAGVRSSGGSDPGAEVWSSSDGTTWKLHTKGYGGDDDTNDVNAMAIYRGVLYADGYNNSTGAEVWTLNTDTGAPSLTLTPITDPTSDTTPLLIGTATDAVGALVSDVEFQIDSTSGSWTDCTADDGSFDESEESFTCTVASALSTGSHTMYVRSTDSNSNTTSSDSYSSDTFTIQASPTSTPSPTSIPGTSSSSSNEIEVQITSSEGGGTVVSAIQETDTGSATQKIISIVEPKTFIFDAFLSSSATSAIDSPVTLFSLSGGTILPNPMTGAVPVVAPAHNNVVAAGNILGITSSSGISWQIGSIQNIWYKAYAPGFSTANAAKIIPELQSKPSIVALSYTLSDLVPPGNPTRPFNPKSLKLAHSIDGITWTILKTSVVDTTNKTVAALDKVGGYYMIVATTTGRRTFVSPSPTTLGETTMEKKLPTDTEKKPTQLPTKAMPEKQTAKPVIEEESILRRIVKYLTGL